RTLYMLQPQARQAVPVHCIPDDRRNQQHQVDEIGQHVVDEQYVVREVQDLLHFPAPAAAPMALGCRAVSTLSRPTANAFSNTACAVSWSDPACRAWMSFSMSPERSNSEMNACNAKLSLVSSTSSRIASRFGWNLANDHAARWRTYRLTSHRARSSNRIRPVSLIDPKATTARKRTNHSSSSISIRNADSAKGSCTLANARAAEARTSGKGSVASTRSSSPNSGVATSASTRANSSRLFPLAWCRYFISTSGQFRQQVASAFLSVCSGTPSCPETKRSSSGTAASADPIRPNPRTAAIRFFSDLSPSASARAGTASGARVRPSATRAARRFQPLEFRAS